MNIIIKVCGVALICIICSVLLKKYNSAYAVAGEISGAVIVLLLLLPELKSAVGIFSDSLNSLGNAAQYFGILAKACAVACISSLVAGECRDTGNNALAQVSELAGKISVVITGAPLIKSVFGAVNGMLG